MIGPAVDTPDPAFPFYIDYGTAPTGEHLGRAINGRGDEAPTLTASALQPGIDPDFLYTDEDGLRIVKASDERPQQTSGSQIIDRGTDSMSVHRTQKINFGPSPESRVQASSVGGNFNIVLNKSTALVNNAAASAAFDRAAAYVETLFDDDITIYIDADFSPLGGNTLADT